jgi:CheY-like chemotaxis protein
LTPFGHSAKIKVPYLFFSMEESSVMKSAETEAGIAARENDVVSGLRILVVEDYAESARNLEHLLGLLGHEVVLAFDGATALAMAQQQEPDVVILDIGLPDADGWEVAKSLQEQAALKRPFFIAVTGYDGEEAKRRSAEAGVDLHLVKPIDPQELAAVLSRFQRIIK